MTKDKVLFYLNRARRRAQCPDHEAMARAGIDYGERQRIARQQEEMKEEVEAWDIVMALLTSLDPGAFIERTMAGVTKIQQDLPVAAGATL